MYPSLDVKLQVLMLLLGIIAFQDPPLVELLQLLVRLQVLFLYTTQE